MSGASGASPPRVLQGVDGWLFWIGNPRVTSLLYRRHPRTWWMLMRWRRLVSARDRRAERIGCRYLQLVIPDKLSVYDHKLAAPVVDARLSPGRRLAEAVASTTRPGAWIDVLGEFRARRDEAGLYYKTDTHWSPAGCRLGYRLLCEACEVEPAGHVLGGRTQTLELAMDTGNKFTPAITETCDVYDFERRALRVEVNDLARFREAQANHQVGTSVGSRIVTETAWPQADPRRVVVFGDSYTFHATGLGPMLAETFREVHMLWSSAIDWSYVERVRPAILVHEVAERFLWRVPTDTMSIDTFGAARLAEAIRAGAVVRET